MRRPLALGALALAIGAALNPARADEPKPAPAPAPATPPGQAAAPANIDIRSTAALQARAGGGTPSGPSNKFRDFNEVTRDSQKIDGLFTRCTRRG